MLNTSGTVILPSTRAIQLTTAGGNGIFRAWSSATLEIDGVISARQFPQHRRRDGAPDRRNTYTGTTTVGGGTLKLSGGANRLPTSTAVTTTGGTLDLNGQNQTVTMLASTGGGLTNSATTDATLILQVAANTPELMPERLPPPAPANSIWS